MMETLHALLESSDIPLLTAFVLGLLTAVSPCPLATNITAVGFISKDIENKNRIFAQGMAYAGGRIVAYTLLGDLLIHMLRSGIDTFDLQAEVSQWGERLLAPMLIGFGLALLLADRIPWGRIGLGQTERAERLRGVGGSLLLGLLFALAFCPTSALFYFGMLIPLAASSAGGYTLPAVYALATGLPVVAVAWLVAYSVKGIAAFYRQMQAFQRWFNRVVALLFIGVGIYYVYTLYIQI